MPAKPRKRQFRLFPARYSSQAKRANGKGNHARNKFQIRKPYLILPVHRMRTSTSVSPTPDAKSSASIGIALSRLNANFNNLIKILLLLDRNLGIIAQLLVNNEIEVAELL